MSESRLACLALLLAAPALLGAACPRRPDDCEHDSIERCNWEQAVGKAEAGKGSGGGSGSGDSAGSSGGTYEGEVSSESRDALDETMLGMVEIMADGLEWSLVDVRARELCRVRDENGELVPAPVEFVALLARVLPLVVAVPHRVSAPVPASAAFARLGLADGLLPVAALDRVVLAIVRTARTRGPEQRGGGEQQDQASEARLAHRSRSPPIHTWEIGAAVPASSSASRTKRAGTSRKLG